MVFRKAIAVPANVRQALRPQHRDQREAWYYRATALRAAPEGDRVFGWRLALRSLPRLQMKLLALSGRAPRIYVPTCVTPSVRGPRSRWRPWPDRRGSGVSLTQLTWPPGSPRDTSSGEAWPERHSNAVRHVRLRRRPGFERVDAFDEKTPQLEPRQDRGCPGEIRFEASTSTTPARNGPSSTTRADAPGRRCTDSGSTAPADDARQAAARLYERRAAPPVDGSCPVVRRGRTARQIASSSRLNRYE